MEPFIGEIRIFAGNFAPRGWMLCQGQLLSVSQYSELFSLLGTIYGGDGRTSFGLPDLRGRTPIGQGNGAGLSSRRIGQKLGSENNILSVANLPSHTHTGAGRVSASTAGGNSNNPAGNVYANSGNLDNEYSNTSNGFMADNSVQLSVSNTGGNQPVNNMQPYLCINFIIATVGVYPSRS